MQKNAVSPSIATRHSNIQSYEEMSTVCKVNHQIASPLIACYILDGPNTFEVNQLILGQSRFELLGSRHFGSGQLESRQ